LLVARGGVLRRAHQGIHPSLLSRAGTKRSPTTLDVSAGSCDLCSPGTAETSYCVEGEGLRTSDEDQQGQ
jgi:hypothetical protein